MIKEITNHRRLARKYTHIRIFLEDRLYSLMFTGEVKVTDSRWETYQELIKEADDRAHHHYELYAQNV